MRLQLIASEVARIPEPLETVKQIFIECESIQEVTSESEIDKLNELLAVGLKRVQQKQFEPINLGQTEGKVRIAKAYYDPNSVHDNFI